jgi:hypothetical protein
VSVVTKVKMYGTLIALIMVTAIGFQFINNPKGPSTRNNKDDNYVLSVKWDPPVLSIQLPVLITAKVDGVPVVPLKALHVSPWGLTMTAEPGAAIELVASSAHPGTSHLDCIIMRNGRSVPGGGYDSVPGPGNVRCVA